MTRLGAGFYGHFEAMKLVHGSTDNLFERALRAIHAETGRVEASFVSKAVATLRPESPVIDKIVRDRFASLVAAPPFGGGLDEAIIYYRWLTAVTTGLAATAQAAAWFAVYDDAFAAVGGASGVHPIKKLDFLLWGGRLVAA